MTDTPPPEEKSQGPGPAAGESPWAEVTVWRKAQRERLLAERQALPVTLRSRIVPLILALLDTHLRDFGDVCIGLYWPFRAEIDIRSLVDYGRYKDAEFALPAVANKNAPLEFRRWRTGDRVTAGVWNIPVPAERRMVTPDILLVPLLGYDCAGYRLGYGGGYYDRTLAAMSGRPHTVGIGYTHAALKTIQPQPHDIPMDTILTEDGIATFQHDSPHAIAETRN